MCRFAVLEHDWPHLHWDLLLERGGTLAAWRLERPPDSSEGFSDEGISAEAIPDHRTAYLDYEGPVSGGRGVVRRWDGGTFFAEQDEIAWRVEFRGGRLRGRYRLERIENNRWVFAPESDQAK